MILSKPILYLVTDRRAVKGASFIDTVEGALKGGVNIVQLRDKNSCVGDILKTARELKELTKQYNVPLIINDSPEIAKQSGADGVHLGMNDGEIKSAREYLGAGAIIGGSARSVLRAVTLESDGADYLGAGAVFGTTTKSDAEKLDLSVLCEICSAVKIPVVAIGGVGVDNAPKLKGAGAAGVAVVSSIMGSSDPENAARQLKSILNEIIV